MKTTKKQNIEAIFPLTYMQQGLLFHHLSNKLDQGFLNVECTFTGELRKSYFINAWKEIIDRHPVLRTTVHWEGLENAVSVVHKEKEVDSTFFHWEDLPKIEQTTKWQELKQNYKNKGVDFQKAPLLKITIVEFDKHSYKILWPNHHLLIDGWSSQVIIDDLLSVYNSLIEGEPINLSSLPTLKSYHNWLNKKDTNMAAVFWKRYFENFNTAPLFANSQGLNTTETPRTLEFIYNKSDTATLIKIAKENRVTLNTLIQGSWSYLLSRYFNLNDVTYGTTVSGRSGDFPSMDRLAGMFMNVQPVRGLLGVGENFIEWLQKSQRIQQEGRQYEHVNLNDITSFINWPEAKPLFDSLLIFENFPQNKGEQRVLELQSFKSGITSTYPLTMVVVPGDALKFVFVVNNIELEHSVEWILNSWKKLLHTLIVEQYVSFDTLNANLPVFDNMKREDLHENRTERKYVPPRDETELQLVNIWKKMLGIPKVGIADDFFALGGKSMLAIRLISAVNKEFGTKLLPTVLLENPNIASIAAVIEKKEVVFEGNFVVPIRASGFKSPLFCVHAGLGHVFFYNDLTKNIELERPVYAVQPAGLYDAEELHTSIEEMAKDYITEMLIINPEGPFNIMVYCWSTAVGLEMSIQLQKLGKKANLMVMDTIGNQENYYTAENKKARIKEFKERLIKNPVGALDAFFKKRINEKVFSKFKSVTNTKQEKTTEKLRKNLLNIYYAYQWPAYNEQITLLVTTASRKKRLNEEIISSWKNIAGTGLNILNLKGKHSDLFKEPNVLDTAKTLEESMQEFETSLNK